MIKTGIPKLDEFLDGGIPKGKSLVYYMQPGVEGEVFGMQTIYSALKDGGNCVLVASSTIPDITRGQFKEFGWDINQFNNKFISVDAYNPLIGAPSKEKYIVSNPDNIEEFSRIIVDIIKQLPPSTIVFGSLSTIMDLCGERKVIEAVRIWNKMAMLYDHVMVYNFTAWPYSQETLDLMKGELFNAVISIGGIVERVIFGQYFEILKSDWTKEIKRSMLFRVLRPGGIKLYIPKILVTGPFDSGKSTFVHALSTRAISVDRLGTTIALDHGHVDYKGFSADIFGTPGQERFDPIIRLLSGESMGVFLVIDSTNPSDFTRAKQMLKITMSYGLPYVIIANKQDLDGALTPEEVREQFDLPEDVPIIPAVAKDKIGVYEAFEVLIDSVTGGI
ncbi:small GTP-binding protein domain [Candidatus Methanoperedens nitroreducens]|uniref:Small GTP-binding protein domain n=1 Tax=Candidatus Methanoperedens nitratireducens TaxID=1392998 RepID=A0A062V7H5_9EURY|nr:ATPase domain-containing protein [Candidatus Methanoperedens nitroreducens]KCZ72488.1 small GTP-binding protein domain [Candidatus Methanoperedens nitroreducens]MDJ1423578.1 ATPase domain-containing protein [Candidatus Methanoperedens sp.]